MFKRVRWTAIGYVAGVGTSYMAARKVKRAASRYTPPAVAQRTADRVKDAVADGRVAMREREQELRREFDRPALRPVRKVPDR